tara:strand:+ start:190 stop:606 length:417 start_codon:yes stop_codon:yes gene_type:complete
MGFFHKFGKKLHKFGQKMEKGVHAVGKFAQKAEHFIEKKALPVASAIAKGVDVGLKIATPVIAGLAPELLPAVIGLEAGVGAVRKGIKGARQGIKLSKQVRKTATTLSKGKFKQGIADIKETRRQGEEVVQSMGNPFA